MSDTSQKRALKNYRNRLNERGLARWRSAEPLSSRHQHHQQCHQARAIDGTLSSSDGRA
jgi:hypothetical protein